MQIATRPRLFDIDTSFTSGDLKAIIEAATGALRWEPGSYVLSDDILVPPPARFATDGAKVTFAADVSITFEDRDQGTYLRHFDLDCADLAKFPVIYGLEPAWSGSAWLPPGSGSKCLLLDDVIVRRVGIDGKAVTVVNIQNAAMRRLQVLDCLTALSACPWTRSGTTATITVGATPLVATNRVSLALSTDLAAIPTDVYAVATSPGTTITVTVPDAGATSGTVTVQYGAEFGLYVTDGARSINYHDTHISSINGPAIHVSTDLTDTRSSKHKFKVGLTERSGCPGRGAIEFADAEQLYVAEYDINAGLFGEMGFRCFASGNRDTGTADGTGDGPRGPTTAKVVDSQIKGFDDAFVFETAMARFATGWCDIQGDGYVYRADIEGTIVNEIAPHSNEPTGGSWNPASVGLEVNTVRRPAGKRTVQIVPPLTVWSNMPSALTEFGGTTAYRRHLNLAQYKFARLCTQASVAGAAGAKLRLALRPASVQIINFDSATGGSARLAFDGQTMASGVAFDAPATGANSVQTKLEGLSNIDPGDVAVTGSAGGPWTVTFGGQYVGVDVPLITIAIDSLTGGGGVHTITAAADTVTTIEALIDTTRVTPGDWVQLDDAARVDDVMMLLYGLTGDGATDPTLSVWVEFA